LVERAVSKRCSPFILLNMHLSYSKMPQENPPPVNNRSHYSNAVSFGDGINLQFDRKTGSVKIDFKRLRRSWLV